MITVYLKRDEKPFMAFEVTKVIHNGIWLDMFDAAGTFVGAFRRCEVQGYYISPGEKK